MNLKEPIYLGSFPIRDHPAMCAVVSTISIELQEAGRNDAGTRTFGRLEERFFRKALKVAHK